MTYHTGHQIDLRELLRAYDERWILSQPGSLNQRDRRAALREAANEISALSENLAVLMAELTVLAIEIQNNKTNYQSYITLQLRAYAIVVYILQNDLNATDVIASSLADCKEIQLFRNGHMVE